MDGIEELFRISQELSIDLRKLIANTAIFAPEDAVEALRERDYIMYPHIRRAKTSAGERRGERINKVLLDDNTYPNRGLKTILAKYTGTPYDQWKNWTVCHVWPRTCYDTRYHTALPNLVMLPSPIAGLSDYYEPVIKDLQFRSYSLFKWYPKSSGSDIYHVPQPEQGYPQTWKICQFYTPIASIDQNQIGGNTSKCIEESKLLPINFDPDLSSFKTTLINTHRAEIVIYYSDGDVCVKQWTASRFTADSDIIGNLRSRREFRQGIWQRAGIERITVRAHLP